MLMNDQQKAPATETACDTTGEDLIQAAGDLIPILRERADRTDRERRVPDQSFQAMQDAGLFRAFKPHRFGGLQLGLWEHVCIAIELARGCSSSGWIFSLLNEASWFVSLLSRQAQDDVWSAKPDACIAGSIRPNASASRPLRVPGGYVVSGKFSFTSGCDHATWIFVGATANSDSEPPEHHLFLIPKSELRIDDDWFVMGMRGTGSRSCVAEKVFVPDHRVCKFADAWSANLPGIAETPDWPLLRAPRGKVNPFIASAPVVGMALGAVDAFKAICNGNDPRKMAKAEHVRLEVFRVVRRGLCGAPDPGSRYAGDDGVGRSWRADSAGPDRAPVPGRGLCGFAQSALRGPAARRRWLGWHL